MCGQQGVDVGMRGEHRRTRGRGEERKGESKNGLFTLNTSFFQSHSGISRWRRCRKKRRRGEIKEEEGELFSRTFLFFSTLVLEYLAEEADV